jgi:DNA-binding NtrC family response regulator
VEKNSFSTTCAGVQWYSPLAVNNHQLRILVVDDQHSVLLTYTWVLQLQGYAVTAASTCAAALEHLAKSDYDLLLCDLGLDGGRSGLEVIDFAQSCRPGFTPILLTGYAGAEIVDDAQKRGIAVLYKPVQVDELLQTLDALVCTRGAA